MMRIKNAPLPPIRLFSGAQALAYLSETSRAGTAFQAASWLKPYLESTNGLEDFRLIEVQCASAIFLLPLQLHRKGGVILADIPGEKHASFHAPVWIEAGEIAPADMLNALREVGAVLGIDAFTLRDSPPLVAGEANPLLALPHRPSPSAAFGLTLEVDGEALLHRLLDKDDRKKLRQKERKLSEFGPLRAGWAQGEAEIRAALSALFAWKEARFGEKGIDNPFAAADIRAFVEQASVSTPSGIRIFTLHAGERLVAAMAGAAGRGQFSGMLNANDPDPAILRSSPGEILIHHLIRALCAEGVQHFDLGVGEARYKAHYCPERIDLFDAALGITMKGKLAAQAFLAARKAKRLIKQNPHAMGLLGRLRGLRQQPS